MKWTDKELRGIAVNRFGLSHTWELDAFIQGVYFALQELEFEDYGGRVVNDGGKHYVVVTTGSVLGENRTFYATEAEAQQGVGAQKLASSFMESLGLLECFGNPTSELVEGDGSLKGGSFCVLSDGSVTTIEEATELFSKEISALFDK